MKKILYFLAFSFCVLAPGCVEDTGNYSYENAEAFIPKVLTEFEDNYNLTILQQFSLDPKVEGNESDYEYLWYAYPTMLAAVRPDTLSRERKLDCTITQSPGSYTIVFVVTDKEHKTAAYRKTTMSVSSVFGVGYYVEKYENGQTDVDFVDRKGEVNPNILSAINGEGIPGRPVNTSYASSQVGFRFQVKDEDGETVQLSSVPTFIVCTDEDMRIYNGDDMQLIKKYEDAFMEVPAVRKPMGVIATSVGFMLNNDNAIHLLSTSSYMGSFGYAFPGDYRIRYLVNGTNGFLSHDDNSGLFLGYTAGRNTPVTEATYKDYELIFFAAQPMQMFISYYSYAVLRHKTTGEARVVQLYSIYVGAAGLVYYQSEVPAPRDAGMLDASVFALGGTGKSVIYYSNGDNEVHYYNYSNQIEKKSAVTLPDGEKIVYMKNVSDIALGPEIFLVLSNKDGKWMLRVYDFEGATHDIKLPARETHSGNGDASTVVYRDANTYITY